MLLMKASVAAKRTRRNKEKLFKREQKRYMRENCRKILEDIKKAYKNGKTQIRYSFSEDCYIFDKEIFIQTVNRLYKKFIVKGYKITVEEVLDEYKFLMIKWVISWEGDF